MNRLCGSFVNSHVIHDVDTPVLDFKPSQITSKTNCPPERNLKCRKVGNTSFVRMPLGDLDPEALERGMTLLQPSFKCPGVLK